LEPFDVLLDDVGAGGTLPARLQEIYGGGLALPESILYANFVESLDGVVALGETSSAGSVISGRNEGDRFVMGLLRAMADAVMVGAGTVRGSPGHQWTPAHVFPELAADFAELRSDLGRSSEPRLVVLTSSGDLDRDHPGLKQRPLILTTNAGAVRMRDKLPAGCEVITAGEREPVDLGAAMAILHDRDLKVVLSEGGPHVIGELVARGLLDELFLTLSPVLAGRDNDDRLGLVHGVHMLPDHTSWASLRSARRHGSHLFLRYSFSPRLSQ